MNKTTKTTTYDSTTDQLSVTLKTVVKQKTRKLTATWTIDMAQDMQAQHGIDIEEVMAKTMQEEIDREITFDIMREGVKSMGWQKAELSLHPNLEDKVAWIHINAVGDYKVIDNHAWFELESDISHFLLKWS